MNNPPARTNHPHARNFLIAVCLVSSGAGDLLGCTSEPQLSEPLGIGNSHAEVASAFESRGDPPPEVSEPRSFGETPLEVVGGIPADVTYAKTGGWWRTTEGRGWLRLVVVNQCGPEHCYDTAFMQWISRNGPEPLLDQVVIDLPVGTYVQDGRFLGHPRRQVELTATDSHGISDHGDSVDRLVMYCVEAPEIGRVRLTRGNCGVPQ